MSEYMEHESALMNEHMKRELAFMRNFSAQFTIEHELRYGQDKSGVNPYSRQSTWAEPLGYFPYKEIAPKMTMERLDAIEKSRELGNRQ